MILLLIVCAAGTGGILPATPVESAPMREPASCTSVRVRRRRTQSYFAKKQSDVVVVVFVGKCRVRWALYQRVIVARFAI